MKQRQTLEQQFWKQVEKSDGCWIWTGAKFKSGGYGAMKHGGRTGPVLRAHRVSWELHRGTISDGLWVLHRCDNPPCVNPEHLFLGTAKDNSEDCSRKKRMVQQKPGWSHRGERHWHTSLSDDDIRSIRSLIGIMPYRDIGRKFNVSATTICDIHKGRVWAHVA